MVAATSKFESRNSIPTPFSPLTRTAPPKTPPWISARSNPPCFPPAAQAVPTGIAIELPPGREAQVRPRSGLALKHSITVNFGTIDPGYRGEIRVVMFNLGQSDYVVEKGDRIAQLIVAPYDAVQWEEGDLADSARGAGGFGSSGR
jgi:dUTP pyrophosphatase